MGVGVLQQGAEDGGNYCVDHVIFQAFADIVHRADHRRSVHLFPHPGGIGIQMTDDLNTPLGQLLQ